jgi:aldehyde dehydrogenase (NAD+)
MTGNALMRKKTASTYPDWDVFSSFGGYKQSGNGREYADFGNHDFMEIKSIVGYSDGILAIDNPSVHSRR